LRGEEVEYTFEGKTRPIALLDPDSGWYRLDHPVPILLAAGGPKSLALAGRVADGVVTAVGPNPDLIRLVRHRLDDASEAAGRERGSVKLIASTFFYLLRADEGIEEAIANGFGSGPLVSCVVNRGLVADHADQLDPEFARAVEHGARAYIGYGGDTSPTAHLSTWRNYMRGLDQRHLDRKRIARPVVDGFAIWGTPEQCQAQARAMLDAGVDVLNLFLSNPATLRRDMTDFSQVIIRALTRRPGRSRPAVQRADVAAAELAADEAAELELGEVLEEPAGRVRVARELGEAAVAALDRVEHAAEAWL
jgi:alkanesulfonate monooxygenase SsuD/methylene tetrahydromethanopterin reductase-like flavin-dependent oxidoreductase (luciferase family)